MISAAVCIAKTAPHISIRGIEWCLVLEVASTAMVFSCLRVDISTEVKWAVALANKIPPSEERSMTVGKKLAGMSSLGKP